MGRMGRESHSPYSLEIHIMTLLNTTTRNAITQAIAAGTTLNKSLAATFTGTTQAQRSTLLWEASAVVAQAYTDMGHGIVEAYASRKGDSIAFGTVMDDGTRARTAQSDAARKWFSRNILGAGFVKITRPTPKFSKVERLCATYERMTAAEQRAFRKALGW